MSADFFLGTGRQGSPKPSAKPSSAHPRGTPAAGRIVKILVGHCHGFIRLHDREIFFHRSDLHEGTAFNDLEIGDSVTFELLDDRVSGARALRVTRRRDQ